MTLDRVGSLEFQQLKKGNRITGDDVLCAWVATRFARARQQRPGVLELGSGTGSIGLLTLSQLPGAHATLVERQELSVALLRRNVAHNRLQDRAEVVHGDIRTVLKETRVW